MKSIHALAIVGALVAGPALAQEYPSSQPQAAVDNPQQAVDSQFMAQIQQQLKQSGHYQGQVDGLYGSQTSQALAQWQRDQGLPATGQIDADTLAALEGDTAATQQAEGTRGSESQIEQQAEIPDQSGQSSELETLRDEHMSAPNVQGEPIPELPGLGTPQPGASPESLETPPRD